jgi:hypothetical protein
MSAMSGSVTAQELDLQSLYDLIQQQNQKIEALREELAATKALADDTRTEVRVTEQQLASTVDYIERQASASSGNDWWERTSVGGYGEIHYNDIDADDSSRDRKETDIHRYVLFVNHEFNDRVRFFSEFEIEHGLVKDTADGSNSGEVEVEQAYVEFDLNDDHQLKAGLFLLPIGIMNETHEPPTFYGVERNDVENIIIPGTWWENGAALSGRYASGISWDFAIHSGLQVPTAGDSIYRIRSGRQKSSNAVAEDLAYTARIGYSGIQGLQLAASYQHQSDISQASGDGLNAASLVSASAIYNNGGLQLRALWAQWDIDGALVEMAGADDQSGWYIEPSYRFAMPSIDLISSIGFYARYEDLEGFRVQDQFEQWEIGVNLWPTDNVVLKLDYRDREHDLAESSGRDFKAIDIGVGFQF